MKRILFATTAAAAMAAGGMAAAQGVTVTGDARLGLGYNVMQNGDIVGEGVTSRPPGTGTLEEDELRAISRVRFGVRMTGETPTGITFGATIRADNAGSSSAGGAAGMAGNVFVSGVYGTLTYGDIASAHQQHSGDLPELGLTGLGLFNEIPYLGNRRHAVPVTLVGSDGIENVIGALSQRPTVRYDFDLAGFGLSVSTDRDLNDIGVGASFSTDFGGATVSIGGGYYDDDNDEQWSVGLRAGFAGFNGSVIYTTADEGIDTLGFGLGTTIADIGLNAYYNEILSDDFRIGDIGDGDNAYGVGMTYGLGGGASLRGGVVRTYGGTTAADLGIQMSF
jgi:outer membrane protein OmpU